MPNPPWRRRQPEDTFPELTRFLRGDMEVPPTAFLDKHRGWLIAWLGGLGTGTYTAVAASGLLRAVSLFFAAVLFGAPLSFLSVRWLANMRRRIAAFVAAVLGYAIFWILVLAVSIPAASVSSSAPKGSSQPGPSMTPTASSLATASLPPTTTPAPATGTSTPSLPPSSAPDFQGGILEANKLWIAVVTRLGQGDGYTSGGARNALSERWSGDALEFVMSMVDRYLLNRWYFGPGTAVETTVIRASEIRPGVWTVEVNEVRHLVTRRLSRSGAAVAETDCVVEVNDEVVRPLLYEVTRGLGAGAGLVVQGMATRIDSRTQSYPLPRC